MNIIFVSIIFSLKGYNMKTTDFPRTTLFQNNTPYVLGGNSLEGVLSTSGGKSYKSPNSFSNGTKSSSPGMKVCDIFCNYPYDLCVQ